MLDDETLRSTIHATIAKQVLEGLDTATRDALLQQAITKALTDYRFTSEINTVVAAKAARVAAELVESDEWTRQIRETIRAGFDAYLANLKPAIGRVLMQALHGEDKGSSAYDRLPALILKCWPHE